MKVMNKSINNIPVKIINTNKFKLVNFEIYFTRKLDYKDIAPYNLLVNMIVSRNSKYPSISAFSMYKENNYGLSVNGSFTSRGDISIFSFKISAINSRFSLNEDILGAQINTIKDCLYNPLLTEDTLNEIKDIYVSMLKDKLNKKTYLLKKKVNALLGEETPYGVNIESTIEDILKVDLNDIKRVYEKLFLSKCYVYVIGEVDENRVYKELEFLSTKENNDEIDLSYLKELDVKENIFESNFLQSAISIIYECNITHKDRLYYPLKVFIEMLNYDLFNIIREKYNYCYYIYALSNNYLNTIEIVSEIESKNFKDIIRIVDEIINSFDNDKTDDFNMSKNKLLNYINSSLDNSRDLASLYFSFDFNKNINSVDELKESYNKVTYDQVKEVSKLMKLKMTSILEEGKNHE